MEKKFYWLYISVFINIIGIGMIFPILPLFAKTFNASAFQVGLLASLLAFVQFATSPFLGKLSDRYGRKPILITSIIINSASFLVTGSASSFGMVFVGMALQGLGSAGVLPAALAYVADVTKGHSRSTYISRVTGTFALGFMIGPVIGGFLANISLSFPFFVAALTGILNVFLLCLFLKETLTEKDKNIVLSEGIINIKPLFFAFKGHFGVLFFLLLVWSLYISHFSLTYPFFVVERFGFATFQTGLLFSLTGFAAALTQWVILPKIEKKMGDLKTIFVGVLLLAFGQLISPIFGVGIFITFTVVTVLGSALMRPSINSYLSKKTTEGQGTTMGLAFSIESFGRVLGPILVGIISAKFGLSVPFFMVSAVSLAGASLFYFVELRKK